MFITISCRDPASCGREKLSRRELKKWGVPALEDGSGLRASRVRAETGARVACASAVWDWDALVGVVYCISLRENDDRFDEVCRMMHRVGLCGFVTFYRPLRDRSPHLKKPGERGCWESHRACFADATARGVSRALILEDDARERRWLTPNAVRRLVRAVTSEERSADTPLPRDWNILNLTFTSIWGGHPITPKWRFWRIYQDCTAAYLITGETMRRMCAQPFDELETPLGIDTYFRKNYKTFTVFPPLFISGGVVSTIQSHGLHALQQRWFVAISWLYFLIVPFLIVLTLLSGCALGVYFGVKKHRGARVR